VFINSHQRFEVLSPEAIETLDRGWRRLLSEIGVQFQYEPALAALRGAGQTVEGDVVRFDPDWVAARIAEVPAEFELAARNPARSLHIGGDHMCFTPVYGAPFIREGDVRRVATIDDFRKLVMLSHVYPEIDSPGGVICEPDDRPLDSRHLDMLHALATISDKPFFAGVISGVAARDSVAMAEIVLGGPIADRPTLLSIVNANSPLRYDDRMLSALMVLAEAGQPVMVTPATMMGAMAPVSTPAALAQNLAEAFAAMALMQVVRPGCPALFGAGVLAVDMRTGAPGYAGPELSFGLLAGGQLARHYDIPWRAVGGAFTTSQVPDAQAGFEGMQVMKAAFLAGANVSVHCAGWLDAGLTAGYEKFAIDIEILRSLLYEFTPVVFDEASLAFDAHAEVGHGGHFFGAAHTLERCRTAFYQPYVATTDNFDRWSRKGSLDTAARAAARWREALESYVAPPLADDVREELDEYVVRRRAELGD
jgi:trimethylamine--corrinoid protein Co-methyltransferase